MGAIRGRASRDELSCLNVRRRYSLAAFRITDQQPPCELVFDLLFWQRFAVDLNVRINQKVNRFSTLARR